MASVREQNDCIPFAFVTQMTYDEINEQAISSRSTFMNELHYSFMHTSNPPQRISRTAIARITLIKICMTSFNNAIQRVFHV